MLKYRIISFPLLLALLLFIFLVPGIGMHIFLVLAPIMIFALLIECGKLLNTMGFLNSPVLSGFLGWVTSMVALACTALSFGKYDSNYLIYRIPIIFVFMIIIMLPQFAVWGSILFRSGEFFKRVLGSFGLFASLGTSMIMLCMLYFIQANEKNVFTNLLFYVILTTKAMDTGGYIFGMSTHKIFGNNHKIAPNLSPKKSWEGFFGGLLLSIVVSIIFWKLGDIGYGIWWYVAFGALLGTLSFFGDLTESGIKRSCQVKDSGSWIPGMGGIFDVLDSFIYIGPACAILYSIYNLCTM